MVGAAAAAAALRMHWIIDAKDVLTEEDCAFLSGLCAEISPETDSFMTKMRPNTRALPASWDGRHHPVSERLMERCLPLVREKIGDCWPVWGSLRLCEQGATSPLHCDINPYSDLALIISLFPVDYDWPFLIEEDDGTVVECATHLWGGVLFDSHKTRHGRKGSLEIPAHYAAILRYTRDPKTMYSKAPRLGFGKDISENANAAIHRQAFDPFDISRIDSNGWHSPDGDVDVYTTTDGQFGSEGGWYASRIERILGGRIASAQYRVLRPGDVFVQLSGRRRVVVALGMPANGGQIICDGVLLKQGDAAVGDEIKIEPLISGEQRYLIAEGRKPEDRLSVVKCSDNLVNRALMAGEPRATEWERKASSRIASQIRVPEVWACLSRSKLSANLSRYIDWAERVELDSLPWVENTGGTMGMLISPRHPVAVALSLDLILVLSDIIGVQLYPKRPNLYFMPEGAHIVPHWDERNDVGASMTLAGESLCPIRAMGYPDMPRPLGALSVLTPQHYLHWSDPLKGTPLLRFSCTYTTDPALMWDWAPSSQWAGGIENFPRSAEDHKAAEMLGRKMISNTAQGNINDH